MTDAVVFDLVPRAGFRSPAAATFVAQLDDLARRLTTDVQHLTPEDYAWQPSPGVNTIGMLLAHMAIVEVAWTDVTLAGQTDPRARMKHILGITAEDDGLPMPAGATPPAGLEGKTWGWFANLHAAAHAHLVQHTQGLSDEDLIRAVERDRGGRVFSITPRWTLHHLVEHYMGHYGQILLLRHMRKGAVTESVL